MKILLLIQLLILCESSFGQTQNDSLSIAFIRDYIKPSKNSDTITYAGNLMKSSVDYLKSKFKTKSNLLRSYDGDTLILTEMEKRYILDELEKLKTFKWKNDLFDKGKIINGNTVWNDLEKGKVKEVDVFSRPIYIRDSSIFLFYHIHFSGLGGPDYFGFFKQVDGKWSPGFTVFSGWLN